MVHLELLMSLTGTPLHVESGTVRLVSSLLGLLEIHCANKSWSKVEKSRTYFIMVLKNFRLLILVLIFLEHMSSSVLVQD